MSQTPTPALPTRTLAAAVGLFLAAPAFAGAQASSFRKETRRGANFWNAQAALDGKLDTCWQLPGDSTNIGEYIIIDVPRVAVDKIGMVTGWAKSEDSFQDRPRVKTLAVEAMVYSETNELVPAGGPVEIEFEDKMDFQVIDFEDINAAGNFGGKVKLTIKEVYDGKDYPNLAISEVVVYLSEFEAGTLTVKKASNMDSAPESMLDGNKKSVWTAPSDGATFTLAAPGFMLSSVDLTPGPKSYDRPKKVEVTTFGRTNVVELPDTVGPHKLEVPASVGYTGTWNDVDVKILEVYPGTKATGTLGIAELEGKASSNDGL